MTKVQKVKVAWDVAQAQDQLTVKEPGRREGRGGPPPKPRIVLPLKHRPQRMAGGRFCLTLDDS